MNTTTLAHDFYMQLAINEAWKYQGLTLPNPAVGALLLGNHGEILAIKAHERSGAPHAEVLALQEGYARLSGDRQILSLMESHLIHDYLLAHHQGIFAQCTLYTTLEPCNHMGKTPACSKLLIAMGLKEVIIGAYDNHALARGGLQTLKNHNIPHRAGICNQACLELLFPFSRLQKTGRLCFFKWAQRLNGTLAEGIISSTASRTHVHALRDRIELLVISGKTARHDNPRLDARLINGRAPDVAILTRDPSSIPPTLNLFGIPARKVFIVRSVAELKERFNAYRLIMIEGGAEIFTTLFDEIDLFLGYISPALSSGHTTLHAPKPLSFLHINSIGEDIITWMIKSPQELS